MLLLFLCFPLIAASPQWVPLASLPCPRSQHSLVASCNSLLAIGGLAAPDEQKPLASVDAYNVQTNTWNVSASMSMPRFSTAVSLLGGMVYVFGGYVDNVDFNITDSVERFDCLHWSAAPPLPLPLAGASAVAVSSFQRLGSGIVIAGGFVGDNLCSKRVYFFNGTHYDAIAPLMFGRALGSLLLVSHSLYSLVGSAEDAPALNTVEECALDTGCLWKEASDTQKARNLAAGVAVGGLLFVIGGFDPEIKVMSSVELLNTTDSSEWGPGPSIPSPRAGGAAASVNSSIYFCGGFRALNATAFDNSLLRLEV